MAKLYFRYGAVGSAKTLNLLAVAHNYKQQGKNVILLKPSIDTRFGQERIVSRAGLQQPADLLVDDVTILPREAWKGNVNCILVDEVQFFPVRIIDELRAIAWADSIPVLCYGLRADFRTHLFPASKRLMEVADSIEEVKSTCIFCDRKATMNLKHVNGVPSLDGPSVDIGAEEKYLPTCFRCYSLQLQAIATHSKA